MGESRDMLKLIVVSISNGLMDKVFWLSITHCTEDGNVSPVAGLLLQSLRRRDQWLPVLDKI